MGTTIKYNDALNILGGVVRKYRIKRNMSLEQISCKMQELGIHISAASIYKIENNERF